MEIITKDDFIVRKEEIRKRILNGAVFIYPTDTIYGLGCNALHDEAVQKIRDIKDRPTTPFSVIAPSKDWIVEHCGCINKKQCGSWLKKLPGPYTIIHKYNKSSGVSSLVTNGIRTIGVRIPDHWFSKISTEMGIPIVTTSANKVGRDFMTSLENLDRGIKPHVDFIIYEGEKRGRPSQIIDLVNPETKIIER